MHGGAVPLLPGATCRVPRACAGVCLLNLGTQSYVSQREPCMGVPSDVGWRRGMPTALELSPPGCTHEAQLYGAFGRLG
jgi:hypothetical protein